MEYECTATLWTTVDANYPENAENKAHQKFYDMVRNGNFKIEKTEMKEDPVETPDEHEEELNERLRG